MGQLAFRRSLPPSCEGSRKGLAVGRWPKPTLVRQRLPQMRSIRVCSRAILAGRELQAAAPKLILEHDIHPVVVRIKGLVRENGVVAVCKDAVPV
jgi:hypothetical protein